jgi:hypothetical protein
MSICIYSHFLCHIPTGSAVLSIAPLSDKFDLDLMPSDLISSGDHGCIYHQEDVEEVPEAISEEKRELCKTRFLRGSREAG